RKETGQCCRWRCFSTLSNIWVKHSDCNNVASPNKVTSCKRIALSDRKELAMLSLEVFQHVEQHLGEAFDCNNVASPNKVTFVQTDRFVRSQRNWPMCRWRCFSTLSNIWVKHSDCNNVASPNKVTLVQTDRFVRSQRNWPMVSLEVFQHVEQHLGEAFRL
ncbi:hypothetical protein J6590_047857, partial [Homalodisca vitripennis]